MLIDGTETRHASAPPDGAHPHLQDEDYMRLALEEAQAAAECGEIPIGAVLIDSAGTVIARAGNRTIADCDPTAHSEILVLRKAAQHIGNYRLTGCALYVSVEPCVMCAGALIQARIRKLVFGAYNLRGGACGTDFDLTRHRALNHAIAEVKGGVLAEPCSAVIQQFFRNHKRDK